MRIGTLFDLFFFVFLGYNLVFGIKKVFSECLLKELMGEEI